MLPSIVPPKLPSIPQSIDMYNYFMTWVDEADQLRSYYATQRTQRKCWKALWHFRLDTAITNGYKLAHCIEERSYGHLWEHLSHKRFRQQLASQHFEHVERLGKPPAEQYPLTYYVMQTEEARHVRVRLYANPKACRACVCSGRKASHEASQRKALGELSINRQRGGSKPFKKPKRCRRGLDLAEKSVELASVRKIYAG